MTHALAIGGNPSSVHARGRAARAVVEDARETGRRAGRARRASEVIFTSGGTEANALALFGRGRRRAGRRRVRASRALFVSAIEHTSVLATADRLAERFPGCASRHLAGDGGRRRRSGRRCASLLREGKGRALVAVMAANNETGVIQPLAEVATLVREADALLLVDAVQAAGKIDAGFCAVRLPDALGAQDRRPAGRRRA